MKSKKHIVEEEEVYVSVRIKKSIVEKVRENKEKTFIPIGVFFEMAAEEKLKKSKK
jgi:hypothetical protein